MLKSLEDALQLFPRGVFWKHCLNSSQFGLEFDSHVDLGLASQPIVKVMNPLLHNTTTLNFNNFNNFDN